MKGNVNLIKRYNDVKITPTGIDGPCRDEPDGAAAADTVRDKAETTQHQVTTDNDQNDNDNADNADNADNTTTGHLHRAVSEKSVKIEPLQRMKPTTPICQLLDQTPRLPRAKPPIPRRISSLYRVHSQVQSPRSPKVVMLNMGTTHL
jgi:hypothetical protein